MHSHTSHTRSALKSARPRRDRVSGTIASGVQVPQVGYLWNGRLDLYYIAKSGLDLNQEMKVKWWYVRGQTYPKKKKKPLDCELMPSCYFGKSMRSRGTREDPYRILDFVLVARIGSSVGVAADQMRRSGSYSLDPYTIKTVKGYYPRCAATSLIVGG